MTKNGLKRLLRLIDWCLKSGANVKMADRQTDSNLATFVLRTKNELRKVPMELNDGMAGGP